MISTDLFCQYKNDSNTFDSDPYILVEAKAVALDAQLKYTRRRNIGTEDLSPTPNQVEVTIGLFTIIKLFRIVQLSVQSHGFCIPPECEEIAPQNACEFFESIDFPMDIFAPPQKPEFLAGISGNIPPGKHNDDKPCGCD